MFTTTATAAPAQGLRNGPLLAAAITAIEIAETTSQKIKTGALTLDPTEPITLWDQTYWRNKDCNLGRCGTKMCTAGWVCELADREWLVTYAPDGPLLAGKPTTIHEYQLNRVLEYVIAKKGDPEHAVIEMYGHQVITSQALAMSLLGLNPQICRDIDGKINPHIMHPVFASANNVRDLRDWHAALYPAA